MADRQSAPKGKPTIRDVAERAGVSIGTVSRALNRAGRVSEAAIKAVEAAAASLGYAPDAAAQSLRTKTTGVVGLLVADLSHPYTARIVNAIEARLQADGYALLVANTHDDAKRERTMLDLFRRRSVDGVILGPCGAEQPEVLHTLRTQGMPAVAIDRDLTPFDSGVQADFYTGALQATRYLLDLGHRRIALLSSGAARRPGRERIAAFGDAYVERGLKPDATFIRAEPSSPDFAFSDALALLSSSRPPTAFFCMGARTLAGVLHGVRHSGLTVPEDISILSVGDSELSQLFSPAITSLTWDFEAVGSLVSELLLKRLTAKQQRDTIEAERVVLGMQLVLRESCGPVGRALTPHEAGADRKAKVPRA